MIDDILSILRQEQLFGNLLFQRCKSLLVRISNRGEDYRVGLNHLAKSLHLALLRDSRLDNRHIIAIIHHQERECHTQLRVITARRAEDVSLAWRTLRNPLLYSGFSVRACDCHNLTVELLAMMLGQCLQCCERIVNHNRSATLCQSDLTLHHKGLNTSLGNLCDMIVSIVIHATHSHKKGIARYGIRTAVGSNRCYLQVATYKLSANDLRYI